MSNLYWLKGNLAKRFLLVLGQVVLLVLGGLFVATVIHADGPIGLEELPGWFSSDSDRPTSGVAWGDVDGDGDLDLVMGDRWGNPRLYENVDGVLQKTAVWLPDHGFASSDAVAWGDIDGDGDLDLATGSNADIAGWRLNRLYLNDGGVLQMTSSWGCSDTDQTFSVAWGDMNGDGHLDLAVGNWGTSKVYLNNGTMLQTTAAWAATVTGTTTSVAWGDVDGDGDLDLAMGNEGMANRLYLNVGGNLQVTAAWASDEVSRTRSVAWGDVDDDGDLDLAVGNGSNQYEKNQLYLNDGTSLHTTADWTSDEAYSTYSVAWGDADGDGDLDLAAGNGYPGSHVYLNQDGALQTAAAWSSDVNDKGRSVAWGDVDGDGDLDLAVASDQQPNRLYLNAGGGFNTSETSYANGAFSNGVALGDVDGDGDLDLAYGDSIGPNGLFLNVDGKLQESLAWSSDENDDTNGVAWGDVDGDGDLDLAVANSGSPSRMYLNVGGNLQTTATWSSDDSQTTKHVAWGDADGDGDLDLAVGNFGDLVRIYYNMDGNLETTPGWSSKNQFDQCMAWGDVDGDGDLDLAVGNRAGHPDTVYVNINGQLQDSPAWSSDEEDDTFDVAWGDVDSDGDLDLAVANYRGANKVYFNIDGRLQTEAGWVSKESDENYAVAWGDVDGDGDIDLVTGSDYVPARLYLNENGSLQTTAAWASGGGNRSIDLALGDIDGDGLLDLATAQAHVELHMGKHVGHPPYSSPARSLAIDLRSDPVQTFAGTATALAPAAFYAIPGVRESGLIPITYTLFNPSSVLMARIEGFYSLDGGGRWLPAVATGDTPMHSLATGPYPTRTLTNTHVYTWDVLESGVFGQSDNVVFRLVAYPMPLASKNAVPDTHRYTNTVAGPYQQAYVAAQTYPFRVRGSQVRVLSSTTPISNAVVYRLPDGQLTGAEAYSRNTGEPFQTDGQGYLQGRGQINQGDQLVALLSTTTAAGESCATYDSQDVPKIISDSGTPIINSTLDVAGVGTIADVNVTVSGTHTWVGDLIFTLQSPGGTSVQILDSPCWYNDDFNLTLDDEAASTWTCPPTGGQTALPSNPLSDFDGENGMGEWTLTIQDTSLADGGSLDNWSLEICSVGGSAKHDLYYTNITPTITGLDAYTVTQVGVQTLTISTDKPLILFNLDVSLEWDARKDTAFLEQLDFDLHRVSEFLFDVTNGQAALGDTTIYHDKGQWDDADVRIYASNALIPNADVGGVVPDLVTEVISNNLYLSPTVPYTLTYWPGFARMGGGEQDIYWPYELTHELSHYLFYLNDNYIGLDQQGLVVPVTTCTGTLMTNPYAYTEFHPLQGWDPACVQTISAQRSGRADWDTISHFYPELGFTDANPGPAALPLAVTQINQMSSSDVPATLDVPLLKLIDEYGAARLAGEAAQAVLYHEGTVINLGQPRVDKVPALGAEPGDRLCVYELREQPPRLGCTTISAEDATVVSVEKPDWQPEILIHPETFRRFVFTVTHVSTDVTLLGRFYPEGMAAQPVTFTLATGGAHTATVVAEDGVLGGYLQVWVLESESTTNPRREALVSFALGGSADGCEGCKRQAAPAKLAHSQGELSPAVSPDGQVLLYAKGLFDKRNFYALQQATRLPDVPAWATVVRDGYYVLKSVDAPSLENASINFRYRAEDVAPGQEAFVALYHWTGTKWDKLPTTLLKSYFNEASAQCVGSGLYALMSSLEIPIPSVGWNLISYPVQETREVTDALKSIEGYYGLVYGYDAADTGDPWKVYKPNSVPPWVNDLHTMEFGHGYWISVTEPITWMLEGGSDTRAPQSANLMGPPATYYGVVSSTAPFVPVAGMTVSAYVDGALCGRGETLSVGGDIVYSVNVGYTPVGGMCGVSGQVVTFQVESVMMSATAEWNNHDVWQVPLYLAAVPPTISDIADQSTWVSTPVSVTFSISDTDSGLDSLWLYAESSNLLLVNGELSGTLMLGGGISFGGSGMTRTATITPTDGLTGTSTITITVDDGEFTASDSFTLTVEDLNTAPTISDIADQSTRTSTPVTVTLTISDAETIPDNLVLSASSSNATLVTTTNILFEGSGMTRTATITPTDGLTGTTTITITVDDGEFTDSESFGLTVERFRIYLPLILRDLTLAKVSEPSQGSSIGRHYA